ncbi:MAG: hypothetical protein AAF415_00045 [Pseudomonadota bacterium]
MITIRKARAFIKTAPAEALSDTLGLGAMCLMIFAGFTVPAFL